MENRFINAVGVIEKIFKRRKPNHVVSVALYGSVAREESVEGWSDIDIIIFIDEDIIQVALLNELKSINEEIHSNIGKDMHVVFRIHSRDELPFYFRYDTSLNNFSLLNYMQDIKTVYGRDFRYSILQVLQKKGSAEKIFGELRSKIVSIRHEIRSVASSIHKHQSLTTNLHTKTSSLNSKEVSNGKFIDGVLDIAQLLLFGIGVHVQKKEDIALKFLEYFKYSGYADIIHDAVHARDRWPSKDINESRMIEFTEGSIYLFETSANPKLIEAVYKKVLTGKPDLLNLPYRKNVCAIIKRKDSKILIVQKHEGEWQFPQGGVDGNEKEVEALNRELLEEVGIKNIDHIKKSRHTNLYNWPRNLQEQKGFVGQIQSFFVANYDGNIELNRNELKKFLWVNKDEVTKFVNRGDLVEVFNNITSEGLL